MPAKRTKSKKKVRTAPTKAKDCRPANPFAAPTVGEKSKGRRATPEVVATGALTGLLEEYHDLRDRIAAVRAQQLDGLEARLSQVEDQIRAEAQPVLTKLSGQQGRAITSVNVTHDERALSVTCRNAYSPIAFEQGAAIHEVIATELSTKLAEAQSLKWFRPRLVLEVDMGDAVYRPLVQLLEEYGGPEAVHKASNRLVPTEQYHHGRFLDPEVARVHNALAGAGLVQPHKPALRAVTRKP